jgi:hypothetical protein
MNQNQHQFIYDQQWRKTFAVLPISDYEEVLERIEDLEDARIFAAHRDEKNKDSISLEAFKEELKREGRISS